MLERYLLRHPDEAECVARIVSLVRSNAECFERTSMPGHITASAWIASPDRRRFLLTHHRKLDRWLQLGGHADGDPDPLSVCLREAREESGMERFDVFGEDAGGLVPIDVDVHAIPARMSEPEHDHHDIRFLLIAAPGQPLVMSRESNDLRWFTPAALPSLGVDESLLRLARKSLAALGLPVDR